MMRKFVWFYQIFVFIGISQVFSQPSSGDWIITGTEVVTNCSITMNGNIIIKKGGSLTLKNVTLRMNLQKNLQYKIYAEPGSSLSISDCNIDSTDSRYRFLFIAEGAKFIMQDTEVRGVGFGCFVEPELQGVALIKTSGAVLQGNKIYHENASGISLYEATDSVIENNEIAHLGGGAFGVHIWSSSNNLIKNNTLINHLEAVVVIFASNKNSIVNNKILDSTVGIIIRNGAGENYVAKNKVKQLSQECMVGLCVNHTPFPNTFIKNSIKNRYVGAYLTMANDTILAQNDFSDSPPIYQHPFIRECDLVGKLYVFRCQGTYILNNHFGPSKKGAITLLFSKKNIIEGNSVSDCRYGLSLFHSSNKNLINNNMISNNRVNIILNSSIKNSIKRNNFIEGEIRQGYDNAKNSWDQNFWNDWSGRTPYEIPPKGSDPNPSRHRFVIKTAEIPHLTSDPSVTLGEDIRSLIISEPTEWKDKVVDFEWGSLSIEQGASLTITNATVVGASNWIGEPNIIVESGGALYIHKSKIIANPPESYLSIVVRKGGKIEILGSELEKLGASYGGENGVNIQGDNAVIKNSIFKENLAAIYLARGTCGHLIINNTISKGHFGIFVQDLDWKSRIENNRVSKIANDFIDKLIPHESNSTANNKNRSRKIRTKYSIYGQKWR